MCRPIGLPLNHYSPSSCCIPKSLRPNPYSTPAWQHRRKSSSPRLPAGLHHRHHLVATTSGLKHQHPACSTCRAPSWMRPFHHFKSKVCNIVFLPSLPTQHPRVPLDDRRYFAAASLTAPTHMLQCSATRVSCNATSSPPLPYVAMQRRSPPP